MKTLYQKHYKQGFTHTVNRHVLGLKKPNPRIRYFWYGVIVFIIVFGILLG